MYEMVPRRQSWSGVIVWTLIFAYIFAVLGVAAYFIHAAIAGPARVRCSKVTQVRHANYGTSSIQCQR